MNMRPIDADALFRNFTLIPWYDNADRDEIALSGIDSAPTLDVEQVVRCRQCKYRKDRLYCRRIVDRPVIVCDTDFCSYGKA